MAQTVIVIDHDESQDDITRLLLAKDGDRQAQGVKMLNTFSSFISGFRKAKIAIGVIAAKASGTLTCASVVATNTVTINGSVLTAVASGAVVEQFNVGGDNTITAANLAAAINASANLSGYVTATSALAVVTVTATKPGKLGNAVTLAAGQGTITVSGARLTAGTDGADARTYYFGGAV